ncbi:unnamed protein product, partial [Cyprideis torosa]
VVLFYFLLSSFLGYGHIAPVTTPGRVFCIIFALIGVPITLTAITDLGKLLASFISWVYQKLKKRCKVLSKLKESTLAASKNTSAVVLGALTFLTAYISIGGFLFMMWEDWSFFEAFYFCFITMTTIGLGDFVPKQHTYMFLCTIYILLGLALTSTIIELVRRQYADSWARMKELSGRLAELSGPLSETLKKLGDQASAKYGDGVDVGLLKELRDLKKVVAETKFELDWRGHNGDKKADLIFDEDEHIVWVIYESYV